VISEPLALTTNERSRPSTGKEKMAEVRLRARVCSSYVSLEMSFSGMKRLAALSRASVLFHMGSLVAWP